jgi:hypothetical protein
MAEHHDRNHQTSSSNRPKVAAKDAACNYDRQADQRHHAGLAVGKFALRPADEDQPSPLTITQ